MTDLRANRVQATTPAAATGRVRRVGADERGGQNHQDTPRRQAAEDRSAETGGALHPSFAEVLIDPHTDEVVIRVRDAVSHSVLAELDSSELERVSRELRSYSAMLARSALTRARTPA